MRKSSSKTNVPNSAPGSGEPHRALTVRTPDLVFIVDEDMRVVLANPAAAHFAGRSLDEIKGTRIADLFGPEGAGFEERVVNAAAAGRSLEFEKLLGTGGAGAWMKASLVSIADVAPGFVLGASRDAIDSSLLQVALQSGADEVEYLATHDSLTGVANRRAFVAALEKAVALVHRGISSTAFYMDIDRFKDVNDQRGHDFGDETLVAVARRLEDEVRQVDLVGRMGGDEFAALLTDSTEAGALGVAERMKASVEALGAEIGIPISLSTGIAAVAGASVDQIMSLADRRMYAAKAANGGLREHRGITRVTDREPPG